MRNFIVVIFLLLIPSCVSVKPLPTIVEKTFSPFPPKPALVEYSQKPIIATINENYEVSKDFVGNSIKLKKYADNVDSWKKLNNIK